MGRRSPDIGWGSAVRTRTSSGRKVSMRAYCMTLLVTATLAHAVSGQDVTELLGAGRYEEAAALLANVGPETAYVGAEMIFERAYGTDFANGDYTNAIRGFTAGATVPHLTERQRQRFDFWHGSALATVVRRGLQAGLGREEAIAMLEEAYALLMSARDYAAAINQVAVALNVARLIDELSAGR